MTIFSKLSNMITNLVGLGAATKVDKPLLLTPAMRVDAAKTKTPAKAKAKTPAKKPATKKTPAKK